MSKEEYIERAGLFAYDRLSCLRNEYAFNDCTKCAEICPENAFVFIRGKLRLDGQLCNGCGVCIGSCPTNSLFLVGDSISRMTQKIINEDKPVLSCENQKSCLAKYTGFDYIYLAIESKKSFTCKISTCKDCEINNDGKIQSFIEKNIDEANIVLENLCLEKVEKSYEKIETISSRRAFFRSLKMGIDFEEEVNYPLSSLQRVKKSLKNILLDIKDTKIKTTLSFSHAKQIDKSCTNCGECIEFCPTDALSISPDKTKIIFQMGKCIGCKICEDICKTNSITAKQKEFDMVDFAYERMEILIEHQLKVCKVCKCSFSYHGGEEICDRCESFENEHTDMFKLASDII